MSINRLRIIEFKKPTDPAAQIETKADPNPYGWVLSKKIDQWKRKIIKELI
jgi:hypothetical protein